MKLKYVDGLKIRNTIDPNFGVIGSSRIYSFIPFNEIWFDKHYLAEKNHFLKIHLYELKLMKKMTYEQARKIVETKFLEKIIKIPNFVVKTKKYNGYLIKYVDGRIIRRFTDAKFILGCHFILGRDYMKQWRKEIWIDIRQNKKEYKYTLLHEFAEAELMKKGMSYNDAHDFALAEEKRARRKDGAVYLQD